MKIANRYAILLAWALAWINPGAAWADATLAPAPSAMPPAVPAPAAATLVPQQADATTAAISVTMPAPAAKAPNVSPPKIASFTSETDTEIKMPDSPKGSVGDKKDPTDPKVPDAVKEVIKNLSNKTGDVTLDDLNAAREAVAKLDALIDIEKRLVDLDKIRAERDKENDRKLAEAIPKSALMPPPSYVPSAGPKERTVEAKAPPPRPAELEIIRIEGSNSRYGALVKDGDTTRMVHAGDHLSDGSAVLSVTTQGVELERDRNTHLAQIKDVQAVFGNSP